MGFAVCHSERRSGYPRPATMTVLHPQPVRWTWLRRMPFRTGTQGKVRPPGAGGDPWRAMLPRVTWRRRRMARALLPLAREETSPAMRTAHWHEEPATARRRRDRWAAVD